MDKKSANLVAAPPVSSLFKALGMAALVFGCFIAFLAYRGSRDGAGSRSPTSSATTSWDDLRSAVEQRKAEKEAMAAREVERENADAPEIQFADPDAKMMDGASYRLATATGFCTSVLATGKVEAVYEPDNVTMDENDAVHKKLRAKFLSARKSAFRKLEEDGGCLRLPTGTLIISEGGWKPTDLYTVIRRVGHPDEALVYAPALEGL